MTLTDIRLQQYRSYTDSSFEFGEGVNIVVGPNAAGKTNLLEAVMVNCTGKSYRARDAALVREGCSWARIDIHNSANTIRTVKLQFDQSDAVQKTFEIDEKVYKRLPQNHKYPIVLFEPNNLRLIESEPSLRRDYMDDLIEQYTPGYERTRNQYRRALAQRNALLKQGPRAGSQLFAWNLRLSDLGGQIVKSRLELIERINRTIAATYGSVAGHAKEVALSYESPVDSDNYSTSLLKKYETSVDLDMARGFTGHGPHRDDLAINFSGQAAILSASRGEMRTFVLALKTIELDILHQSLGFRPLLLLDDVFSELDGARRKSLTEFLKGYQTIITTTDADVVLKNFTDDCAVILI